MPSFVRELFFAAALFLTSVAFGALWLHFRRRTPRSNDWFPAQSVVRLKTNQAMYRTRVAYESAQELILEAPLSRDAYVPIRIGDAVAVEATTPRGLIRFRSHVSYRDESTHQVTIKKVHRPHVVDRREDHRVRFDSHRACNLDGHDAHLFDISRKGASIECIGAFEKGERVRVECASEQIDHMGWIIERLAIGFGPTATHRYRLVLEEPYDVTS